MRQVLILVLVLASTSPFVLARNKRDWERAKKLKRGSSVYVTLWKGQPVSGRVVAVDAQVLRLETLYSWDNDAPEQIARENVERIVLLRHPLLPDLQKLLIGGALIGGVAGVTIGAIRDAKDSNNGNWAIDGLAGAGLGFFGACVTGTGLGVAALFHHDKLVYQDNVDKRLRGSGARRQQMPLGPNFDRRAMVH
jgi:hypothetical protein